jgi:hypothetical protein
MAERTLDGDDIECPIGNIWSQTECILTYNGSIEDVILNYFVLAVNLAYCVMALRRQRSTLRQQAAGCCLLGVVAFQWTLCLAVECSGISIIWCAMCGWTMNERRRNLSVDDSLESSAVTNVATRSSSTTSNTAPSSACNNLRQLLLDEGFKGVLFLDLVVILYYAVTMETLSTIAHICALILGATLEIATLRLVSGRTENTPNIDSDFDGSSESSNTPLVGGESNSSTPPE